MIEKCFNFCYYQNFASHGVAESDTTEQLNKHKDRKSWAVENCSLLTTYPLLIYRLWGRKCCNKAEFHSNGGNFFYTQLACSDAVSRLISTLRTFPKGKRTRGQWMGVHLLPSHLSLKGISHFRSTVSYFCPEDEFCILSPCLFNLHAEYITRNAGLDKAQAGPKIAWRNISKFRYADDTTFMAESEEELKNLLMKV